MNPLCVSFLFFDGDVIVVTHRGKKRFSHKIWTTYGGPKGKPHLKPSGEHLEVSGAHMKCFFFFFYLV